MSAWYDDAKQVAQFRRRLKSWYTQHQRPLPFRTQRNPFSVWLSEIMLQQTTMGAMLPFYERFIRRLPDVAAVAAAPQDELLKLWQGLGYYARVRNFQKACQIVMTELGGKIPKTYEGLLALPGIGDYTAAAVASICFDEPRAVLDGNVKRVLARLTNFREDVGVPANKLHLAKLAQHLLNPHQSGDHNQAMMELGALVCKPQPDCLNCPVSTHCKAQTQQPELLPITTKIKLRDITWHALLAANESSILLEAPHAGSVIAGMWQLPLDQSERPPLSLESWPLFLNNSRTKTKTVPVGSVRHTITNRRITTQVYRHQLITPDDSRFQVVARHDLDQLPVNTLTRKILKAYL